MRRLFLHIGAHKTGSTALQMNLHQTRLLLDMCGVCFVSSPTEAHVQRYLGPAGDKGLLPGGFKVLDEAGFLACFAEANRDLVVASAENFSFFFDPNAIAGVERLLRPHFDQITIVSYLRRQDRHAVSHHQEGARPNRHAEGDLWGHAPRALPEYNPNHDLYLDYDRRLGLWADVFGAQNLALRVYDRDLLKGGDIFADFLTLIGVNISGLPSIGDRNVSLGIAQTKAGHLMNAAGLSARATQAILSQIPAEGRLLPSRAEAAAFLDRYREGNRRLNAKYQITDLPDLFNDIFTDLPDAPPSDWADQAAITTLRAILTQLDDVPPDLAAITADDFRIAAQALSAAHPQTALRLINAAHALRPQGPAIQRLKADLDRRNAS